LVTAETASLSTIPPQKLLQFHSVQAVRNAAEVHDAETARWQKPAFIEDLSASVQIKGGLVTRLDQHPKALRLPAIGAQSTLKPANSAIDGFHPRLSRFFQN
jgi:hypothetical protein